jgi:four helix bundle protein
MRLKKLENVQPPTFNFQMNERVNSQKYDLEERLLEYAARVIRLVEKLPDTRAGNHVAGQLLRSGTSPLPNHGEAQAAESRKDFIHKLKICHKELRESRRWLLLIQRVPLLKPNRVQALVDETEELIRIFAASLRTATGRKPEKQDQSL